MQTMIKIVARLMIAAFVLGVLVHMRGPEVKRAHAAAAKNLRVLPKSTSRADVKRLMRTFNKALGVKCRYCHDMDDMATDTAKKETARQMMRMVQRINQKYLPKADKAITCATCHRGQKTPSK